MKNFDAVAALQASGKLDRANLVTILCPDLEVSPGDSNRQISSAYETRVARDPVIMPSLHMLAENSGAKLSAASTPQQIVKAIVDMRTAVENAIRNSYVQDYLEGSDEMDPAREFAFSLAVDGKLGADIVQFSAPLDPDEISGGDIYDDLLNIT